MHESDQGSKNRLFLHFFDDREVDYFFRFEKRWGYIRIRKYILFLILNLNRINSGTLMGLDCFILRNDRIIYSSLVFHISYLIIYTSYLLTHISSLTFLFDPVIDGTDIFRFCSDKFLDPIEGVTRDRISDDRLLSLHPLFEGHRRGRFELEVRCDSFTVIPSIEEPHLRGLLLGFDLLLIGTHLHD